LLLQVTPSIIMYINVMTFRCKLILLCNLIIYTVNYQLSENVIDLR